MSSTADLRRRYLTVPPAPPLRPFLECLWVHAVDGPDAGGDGRILPDGRMDLVWVRGIGVLVAGPQSRDTARPQTAPFLAYGARFHPGAAPLLLGLPAAEFRDGHVPLAAADPRLAALLGAVLEGAPDDRAALARLERALLRALDGLGHPDPAVSAAVGLLTRPSTAVGEVAARVHLSERQLRRRFVASVGYGPKTLARVLRFQRALAHLGAGVPPAAAAAMAGYADGPHLARESRRLAGLSPAALARRAGPGAPPDGAGPAGRTETAWEISALSALQTRRLAA